MRSVKMAPPPAREYPSDPAGMELYTAQYRIERVKTWIIGGLLAAVVVLSLSLTVLALRPPIMRWIRINGIERAAEIQYSDLNFTPEAGMARVYLEDWARFRYTVRQDSFAKEYPKNYKFLSEALAAKGMSEDIKSRLIARVTTGQVEPDELERVDAVIESFHTEQTSAGKIGKGTAVLDVVKVFSPETSPQPRREHWYVPVEFVVNPWQVYEKAKRDPQYSRLDPFGVTVASFHENRSSQ